MQAPTNEIPVLVLINNEQHGPYTPEQVKGYLAMGQLQYSDLAWREGMAEWLPLQQFPEFAPKAHRTPNYKGIPVRQFKEAKPKNEHNGLKFLVALLVVGGLGGGGYYYWKTHLAAGAGEPQTLAELNSWYIEPPAGQNAATFFQQGFDAMQITPADRNSAMLPLIGRAKEPSDVIPLQAPMKTTIRAFIQRNQPAIDLFERGSQCSGCRFPVDFNVLPEPNLSHLLKLQQAAQLLILDATFEADSHQSAEATKTILLLLSCAKNLEAEPTSRSQGTRIACQAAAVAALEQTLKRTLLPADSLTQLKTAFDRAADADEAGNGVNRGEVGERVVNRALFDLSADKLRQLMGAAQGNPGVAIVTDKLLSHPQEQKQFLVDSYNQFLAARKVPFPERLKAGDALAPRLAEAKSKDYLLDTYVLSGLARVPYSEGAGLAAMRIAQTAIALENFRAAHGNRYPDSLSELTPSLLKAVPADPLDGQPLRYRKVGQGYVLYSIGPDLKDDNGTEPGDLVISVTKPPQS